MLSTKLPLTPLGSLFTPSIQQCSVYGTLGYPLLFMANQLQSENSWNISLSIRNKFATCKKKRCFMFRTLCNVRCDKLSEKAHSPFISILSALMQEKRRLSCFDFESFHIQWVCLRSSLQFQTEWECSWTMEYRIQFKENSPNIYLILCFNV